MSRNHCTARAAALRTGVAIFTALASLAPANVDLNLQLWHGYDFFYCDALLVATNPAPTTYHRVESPNGLIWQNVGTDNSDSAANLSLTNNLGVLINECTNGLWRLTLNVGHASQQQYAFSMSAEGVTTGLFGDIVLVSPTNGATVATNPPPISWTGPAHLPSLYIQITANNFPYTFGDSANLPSTATNWTPSAPLSATTQSIFMYYRTNTYAGIAFTVPTNLVGGAAAPGWSAKTDLSTYAYSTFTVPGGGEPGFDEAVESPGLAWTTGGDYGGDGWFVQSNETSVGVSALQSGHVPDYATSWVEATVQGPGTLEFEWNMLADSGDAFGFSATDAYEYEYDGFYYQGYETTGWDYYTVYLEPGPNVLRWTFHNDDDTVGDADAAFLDAVAYYPDAAEHEADFLLTIERVVGGTGDYYVMFPRLSYAAPGYATIESPTGQSSGDDSSSSSAHYATFQALVDEIQAGDWLVTFGGPNAEYSFTIDASALSSNDLPPVLVLNPPGGASGVATNTTFQWLGPTTFDSLFVYDRDNAANTTVGSASLPPAQTSWTYGGALPAGTNTFTATYTSNNYAGLAIGYPENYDFNPIFSWSATVQLSSRGFSQFDVEAGFAPLPVTLLPPGIIDGNLGLGFVSQSGATHIVECRTNLLVAPWVSVTNFTGTGGLELVTLPATNPAAFYRVQTQ